MEEFPLWIQLAALAVLLLISALFSISETSMMALSRLRLRHLARQGARAARRVQALLGTTDRLLGTILLFYTYALFLYILLSWVAPGTYSPAASLLQSLCEPLLRPVRRIIPAIAGIDFSALFVIIGLQALYILIS